MSTVIRKSNKRRRFVQGISSCFALSLLVGIVTPVHAMSFNLTFDPSTAAAPGEFFTGFNNVIQFYQTMFSDPIIVNLRVGWGEVNDGPLNPGNLGQSLTNQRAFTYGVVKAALITDAKTTGDATAVASLPTADPTPGVNFAMSNAEAKALGLLAGNAAGLDGWVGFNNTAAYTFDPNNRAVAGKFDFIGLASHEITEVMGRYGFGQNGTGGRDSPIDLYRYTAPGVRDLAPTVGGAANYFSIDGGVTSINTFNTAAGRDLSDWRGQTLDAYNGSLTLGQALPTSSGDLTEMDVLGYDRVANVPEPALLSLLGVSLVLLIATRHRIHREV